MAPNRSGSVASDPAGSAAATGVVVAAHQAAADAGMGALVAGGSAVDAAVAAGFALCVVDPANCGLGGYGGFLTYAPPNGSPLQVDFNTSVPSRVDVAALRLPGDLATLVDGGGAVAPPTVVPGLLAAHARFGQLPLAELVLPAVRLAGEGFPVGRDLARALAEHWERTEGGRAEFAAIFFPEGCPLEEGARLVQPDLALTLEAIASSGTEPFRVGRIVDAICETTTAGGGFLEPADFVRDPVGVGPATAVSFESATVYGPPRETSGAGVLFSALSRIDPSRLGTNRERAYVAELSGALRAAWQERTDAARVALNARHTTNLCTADAGGGLVALTFTHGSLWFGAGLVASGTGIVLNAGANLFAAAAGGPLAVTNMSPVVVDEGEGRRHALGGTGGARIPGILLSAVVDVVHYRVALADALAAPHLSVRALDGVLEAEPELLESLGDLEGSPLGLRDFGPAAGVTRTKAGLFPAVDPRFGSGVAVV